MTGVLLVVVVGSTGLGLLVCSHDETVKAMAEEIRLRNATERLYFYQDAIKMFKERPILGWGGGGWEEAYRAYQSYLYYSKQVHGHYFQIMVEAGLVGLIVILGIWFGFLLLAHRLYHRAKEDAGEAPAGLDNNCSLYYCRSPAAIDFNLSLSAWPLSCGPFSVWPGALACILEPIAGVKKSKTRGRLVVPLLAVSVGVLIVVIFSGTLAMADTYFEQANMAFQKQDYNQGLKFLQKLLLIIPLK